MTPILHTARLVLRPVELSDAEAMQRLFPHWEIVRLLAARVPWPYPPDGSLANLRDTVLPAVARGEQWAWTLRLRERPDDLIGRIDLYLAENDNRGFWLGLPWQGRGLMREAVEVVTDYWFGPLGQTVLRAPKAVGNHASRRLSEKTGMRLVWTGMKDYVAGRLPAELWEITREEWLARSSRQG